MRLCWPGVITQMDLAPANVHEGEIVWEVTAGTSGRLVGDRNYWLPAVQAALRKVGIVQASSHTLGKLATGTQVERGIGPRALSH